MSVSVVYLAYYNESAGYGLDSVKNFLNSYLQYSAGMEHSLKILAVNWTDKPGYDDLKTFANLFKAEIIELTDEGSDIGMYFKSAKLIKSDYLFFVNSLANTPVNNWLIDFYNNFKTNKKIQLAGTIGFCENSKKKTSSNFHIKTTNFMVKRDLFVEYADSVKFPPTKEDLYQIERGENSLTQFVLNKGYTAVLINPDGKAFEPKDWELSGVCKTDNKADISSDTKVKIFASYYKPAPLIKSNVFEPIFNGASGYANGLDVLTDDTGDNITEKNKNYGELTQQYWVWKNYMPTADNEYVGFCQYHRFLDFELTESLGQEAYQPILALEFPLEDLLKKYTEENIYNYIKDYDIVLPAKIVFGGSNYTQYANCHKKEDLDKALEILARLYPNYIKTAQEVLQEEEMYIYGAFIMKKSLLNEYLQWIFNILTELDKVSDWTDYDEYNRRTPAFIAERFLNVWLKYNIEARNLKMKNTTSQLLCENLDLYLKEALFMMERVKVKDIKKAIAAGQATTATPVALPQPEKKPDPQVKIFSVYYKPAPVFESNVFQPIYNGSVNFALPADALTDNTGDNISPKNPHWGELTQNYWVWKNYMPTSTAKYIGFCHYRRFLDFNMSKISSEPLFPIFINNFPKMFEMYTEENIMKAIEGYDIVIPNKFDCGASVYDQYLAWHPKKDLDLALDVLKELYPEYMPTAEEFLKSTSMYICFNYVMKKELVEEFFEWIFNILNTLEKRCSWNEYTEYFQIRMPAFLAERFFNIWLDYNVKKRGLKVLNSTNILISYDLQEYTQRCLEKMEKLQAQLAGQT